MQPSPTSNEQDGAEVLSTAMTYLETFQRRAETSHARYKYAKKLTAIVSANENILKATVIKGWMAFVSKWSSLYEQLEDVEHAIERRSESMEKSERKETLALAPAPVERPSPNDAFHNPFQPGGSPIAIEQLGEREKVQETLTQDNEEEAEGNDDSFTGGNITNPKTVDFSLLAAPKYKGTKFTTEEDAYLRALRSATSSLSWAEIGEQMGRSHRSVSSRWHMIQGLDRNARTQVAEVVRDIEAKKTETSNRTASVFRKTPLHSKPVDFGREKPYEAGDSPPKKRQSLGTIDLTTERQENAEILVVNLELEEDNEQVTEHKRQVGDDG